MGDQRLPDFFAVSRNDIDHTLGKSGFLNQFYEFQSLGGGKLRRFYDDRIPGC